MRGIVTGEVIRRLVARTIAQQLDPAVEAATSPFQFALSTKSGCECVAHCIQALCKTDERLTLTSVDGVSAFGLISRRAMLAGLEGVAGGASILPFVHLFHGRPSTYLWEDNVGTVHTIDQGEGGEQGDPLLPLLFAVGQHPALVATQAILEANEWIFEYLDDIYILTRPEELLRHAHIRIHGGKTHVWNVAGIEPRGCNALQRIAEASDPSARVWRGADIPTHRQGIRVLGAPVGHPDFIRAQLEMTHAEHQVLPDRIPSLPHLQSAWSLLLHCAFRSSKLLFACGAPRVGRGVCLGSRQIFVGMFIHHDGHSRGRLRSDCKRGRFLATRLGEPASQKRLHNPSFGLLGELCRFAPHGAEAPSRSCGAPPHPLGGRSCGTEFDVSHDSCQVSGCCPQV